jgi:hypothetical protein
VVWVLVVLGPGAVVRVAVAMAEVDCRTAVEVQRSAVRREDQPAGRVLVEALVGT